MVLLCVKFVQHLSDHEIKQYAIYCQASIFLDTGMIQLKALLPDVYAISTDMCVVW